MKKYFWFCLIFIVSNVAAFGSDFTTLLSSKDVIIRIHKGHENVLNLFSPDILKEIELHINLLKQKFLPKDVRLQLDQYQLSIHLEKTSIAEGVFYPPGTHPTYESNKQELIITIDPSILAAANKLRLITHEFLHAVHFVINPNEESWVREGLAQMFEYQVHRNYNSDNILAALSFSSTALNGQFDITNPISELYGSTFLYFYHLSQQCGENKNDFFWALMKKKNLRNTSLFGQEGIDILLNNSSSKNPICTSFKAHADTFMIARAHNQYSGFSQSDKYFIIDHVTKMSVNTHFETEFKKLSAIQKLNFSIGLPVYLPLIITPQSLRESFDKNIFKHFLTQKVKFFLLEERPPFNVSEITEDNPMSSAVNRGKIILFKSI